MPADTLRKGSHIILAKDHAGNIGSYPLNREKHNRGTTLL
jgi:hypothetical protein